MITCLITAFIDPENIAFYINRWVMTAYESKIGATGLNFTCDRIKSQMEWSVPRSFSDQLRFTPVMWIKNNTQSDDYDPCDSVHSVDCSLVSLILILHCMLYNDAFNA